MKIKRKCLGYALGLPATGGALLLAGTAIAVHNDGNFELGNGGLTGSADIEGSGAQPGPDWADIFDANGDVISLFGGLAATFAADDLSLKGATDDTIFASSNKNNDLISTWNWDSGNNPPKDDISNAYVYAKIVNTELVIYAGLERIDAAGDSHVDFEFNQDDIGLDKDPACGSDQTDGPGDGAPCEFVGSKTDGDLLVAMDFEKGGDLGVVRIFEWDSAAGEFVPLVSLNSEGCNAADTVCAFNNGVAIPGGPWPNFDKSGATANIAANGFTEFGVNVSAIEGASPCFASVNLKTRTSQSINSELKDFSLHPFQECNATVATVAFKVDAGGDMQIADDDPTSTPGQIPVFSTVYDTATVTGVSGLAPTGTVTFDLYMSADCTGPLLDTDTVALVAGDPSTAQSKNIDITVAGSYGFIAGYSGDLNYPSASSGCEDFLVNTLNSSVTTDVVLTSDGSSVLNSAVELGTSVKDTARVLGNGTVIPTGDVTFIRYADATCSGTIQSMEDVTLDATGEAESSAYVTGSDSGGSAQFACWNVIYEGDGAYSPSASTIGEPICAFEFDPDLN